MDNLVDVEQGVDGLRWGDYLMGDGGVILAGKGGDFEEMQAIGQDVGGEGSFREVEGEFTDQLGFAIIELISHLLSLFTFFDHINFFQSLINHHRCYLFRIHRENSLRQMLNQLNQLLLRFRRNNRFL